MADEESAPNAGEGAVRARASFSLLNPRPFPCCTPAPEARGRGTAKMRYGTPSRGCMHSRASMRGVCLCPLCVCVCAHRPPHQAWRMSWGRLRRTSTFTSRTARPTPTATRTRHIFSQKVLSRARVYTARTCEGALTFECLSRMSRRVSPARCRRPKTPRTSRSRIHIWTRTHVHACMFMCVHMKTHIRMCKHTSRFYMDT